MLMDANEMDKFLAAKKKIAAQIARSKSAEDPSHAENTMYWVQQIRPDADELLLLAGFGHDIERSLTDRLTHTMFASYDEYKRSHATRSGQMVAGIMLEVGYSQAAADKVAHIIAEGEFNSDDPDVQLLCDADSISFFDNNLAYYIKAKSEADTKQKMRFMYDRVSARAQQHIRAVLHSKPELNLLNL